MLLSLNASCNSTTSRIRHDLVVGFIAKPPSWRPFFFHPHAVNKEGPFSMEQTNEFRPLFAVIIIYTVSILTDLFLQNVDRAIGVGKKNSPSAAAGSLSYWKRHLLSPRILD